MKNNNIDKYFKSFENQQILVIGDVMIDSYMWGKVDRISPEAPVPVVSVTKKENRLGGASNVALNVKSLGATPILCSVIGDDSYGSEFLQLMKEENLSVDGILIASERTTSVKTRVISGNQHLLRVDEEVTDEISKKTEKKFFGTIMEIICNQEIDAIIFEDYDKGVLTKTIISEIVNFANSKKIPTLVDPKRRHFNDYANVTLFKPNFKEFKEGMNLNLEKSDFHNIAKSTFQFRDKFNIEYLLLTLSEKGILISFNDKFTQLPALELDIADVSGAGDTVIATASLCLASGMSPELLAFVSNIAGSLVCEKVGVVQIEKELLLDTCKKQIHIAL